MKSVFFSFLSVIFLLSVPLSNIQAEQYERKSISYVNALWLATGEARKVNQGQVNYMLGEVRNQIELARFDFNPLPQKLIQDFVKSANQQNNLSVNDIAALMEKKLVPTIVSILEGAMQVRAGDLVTDEQKQSFLATKAKELGITLDEIEKVMNSAYLYLPVLTGFERKKMEQKDKFSYKIKGGIIWFQMIMDGEKPVVKLRVAHTTESNGWGSDDFAYESAVRNFARNLVVATKDMPEFKLHAVIVEAEGKNITFELGKKEGLGMDDCLFVGEYVMNSTGDVAFERSGWARVGMVADNTKSRVERSSAWAVKKGSWARGMAVIEHPRLGIDIAYKPMMYAMSVGKGRIPVLAGQLKITEDFTDPAIGMDLDFHINVAGLFNSPQVFFILGGNYALLPGLEFEASNLYTNLTTSLPYVWGFHAGLMKKLYFGQFALSGAFKTGMRYFTVDQDFTFGFTNYVFTIKNNSFGGQFDLGFDYAATPDFNIGLMAALRFYTVSDAWSFSLRPSEDEIVVIDDNFPAINHSGLAYGIYIHYSPPSLPFDPIDYFRAMLGE